MSWGPEVVIKAAQMDGVEADEEGDQSGRKTCRKLGALSHNIKNFMNQPELSDVMIRFAGSQYRSHRVILGAWSPVLEGRLANAAEAAGSSGEDPSQLLVLDFDEDVPSTSSDWGNTDLAFQQFLKFLYSGKTELTERTVKTVMSLAQVYMIQPLQEMCERFIGKEIGQHNVEMALEWLGEAEKRGLALLEENCIKVLQAYLQYIPEKLWQGLRLDQVISIIQGSEVVVEDEFALFLKIESWIKSQQCNLEDLWANLDKILPLIRFAHMTIWQLKQFGTGSRLGQKITQKYPEIFSNALQARALASEEMDFSEVSESLFAPPRLYLKYVPPGGKLSSMKDKDKNICTRARCTTNVTTYSDRQAKVLRKRKDGLYRLAESESFEVTFCPKQKTSGKLWRVMIILMPRYEHIGQDFKVVVCIKMKDTTEESIIVTHCGTVAKGSKRGAADGITLFTPSVFQDKPEYVYSHEVVYVG